MVILYFNSVCRSFAYLFNIIDSPSFFPRFLLKVIVPGFCCVFRLFCVDSCFFQFISGYLELFIIISLCPSFLMRVLLALRILYTPLGRFSSSYSGSFFIRIPLGLIRVLLLKFKKKVILFSLFFVLNLTDFGADFNNCKWIWRMSLTIFETGNINCISLFLINCKSSSMFIWGLVKHGMRGFKTANKVVFIQSVYLLGVGF